MLVQVFGMKDKWSEAAREPGADFYSMRNDWTTFQMNGPQVRSIMTPAITNEEGKFELRGLGKGRLGQFILSGPGIESVKIYARSEAGETITLPNQKRSNDRTDTYYPSEFEYISGPSVPVTGVVRASDTGEPISGVTVKSQEIHGNPLTGWSSDFIRAVSDTDGRYRLEGLPIGKDNVIAAMGPAADESTDSPAYLSIETRVSTEAATEEVERDLEMVRGSWLHGRITDKSTGKGLPGRLKYFAKPSKPYGRGIGFVDERDRLTSDQDGRFRIAVPRGEGYITFSANDHQNYLRATEIQNLDGTTSAAGNMIGGYLIPRNYHLVAEYEADEDEDECERDFSIGRGLSRKGKVVGPDKQPVTGFRYLSRKAYFGRWELSTSDEFDLEDYQPEVQRDVYVVHAAKNLAGHAIATGPTDESLVVKLMEAGTVTGRLVDEDGEPLPNRRLIRWSPPMNSLTETGDAETSPSLPYNARYDHGVNETDDDGNFTLTCLLPDTEYRVQVIPQKPPEFVKSLGVVISVKAGETKDLGDIPIASYDAYLDQEATDSDDSNDEASSRSPVGGQGNAALEQDLEYSGQVLNPDGKPVAGANIYHVFYTPTPMGLIEPTSKPVTTSGADGRFRFVFTRDGSPSSHAAAKYGTAVATKKGFGFGFAHRENSAGNQEDVLSLANRSKDIHLLKDHPIRGRIVNIDGEPVAGARLILTKLYLTANNDLGSWNQAAKEPNADFYSVLKQISCSWPSAHLSSLVAPATTDLDGRFEVRGIGEGQIAHFHLSGPGIETVLISVRTETGGKITLPMNKSEKSKRSVTFYPSSFEHVGGPSVPVSGIVTASDTGDPISGVTVKSEGAGRGIVRAITDENGRYRLEGLPIRERNYIAVLAPSTSNDGDQVPAYLSVEKTVSTTEPTENIDIKMESGSWLFGRITDPETGKGIPGRLEYRLPEKMNSRKGRVYESDRWVSGQDGRFRIAVPKGRGYIAFAADNHSKYFRATKIQGLDGKMGRASEVKRMRSSLPACLIAEYQADDETCERNLEIRKAPTRTGKVIGPDGQPVTDYYYLSDSDYRNWDKSISDGFTLKLYDPDASRDVYFSNLENNLTAHAVVSGATGEPLVVQLVKGGTATGRVVDEDGDPMANFQLSPTWKAPAGNGDTIEKISYISPLLPYSFSNTRGINRGANVTDAEGRFTLTCLLPDTEYRVVGLGIIRVKAGESKDLGDIKYGAGQAQATTDRKGEASSKLSNSVSAKTSATTTTDKKAEDTVLTTDIKLPNGQPAAGAHVALVGVSKLRSRLELISEQVTDADGRCRFELSDVNDKTHVLTRLIARREGYGISWKRFVIYGSPHVAMSLPVEEAIRGQLIDIDGQPAAGERLVLRAITPRVTEDNPYPTRDSGCWLSTKNFQTKAWLPTIVTDDTGRFTLRGIPREHGAYLHLKDSERFAPQGIMLNSGQPEQRTENDGTYRSLVRNGDPGEELVLPLAPAQIFTGKVTCKDSGDPVPNAKVSIWASQEEMGSMVSVNGTTDEDGNYRILPQAGIRFGVEVYPPSGSPYLASEVDDIKWKDGDQSRNVDVSLDRGVLIRGRILEEGTDKPVVKAEVIYEPNKSVPKNVITGWENEQKLATTVSLHLLFREWRASCKSGVGKKNMSIRPESAEDNALTRRRSTKSIRRKTPIR